jgi:ATP-dependent DNA helicase RecG
MIDAAEAYVLTHVRTRSLITGLFRQDIPEYPRAAVREALVNAVAHRDYSAGARGSHVQVKLFSDRLEISSPGGLHGNVTIDTLERSQSARNRQLIRMMQDVRLVENRGSGIDAMVEVMRAAGLEPPQFSDDRVRFTVVFRRHALILDDEGVAWLNAVAGQLPLNERQKLALLYLRRYRHVTNSEYRRLHPGLDSRDALHELQGLVQCGAAVMRGVRGGAWYDLALPTEAPSAEQPASDEDRILGYVRKQGFIQAGTASTLLGWDSPRRAGRFLQALVDRGLLHRQGRKRGTRYVGK